VIGQKPAVDYAKQATKDVVLQDVFYGSDGTRTRDLRRDRPSQATTLGDELL
jgi:hypothetical protein